MSSLCHILLLAVLLVNTCHALIGSPCGTCQEINSLCRDSVCTCINNYIPSNDNRQCLPVAINVGAGCEIDLQCTTLTDLSSCVDNKCKCLPEAAVVDNKCQKRRLLGETCSADNECRHIDSSVCSDSVCSCVQTHVSKSDSKTCLPLAVRPDSECEEAIQCKVFGDQSTCTNTKCACVDSHHYSGSTAFPTQCVKDKGIGEACANVGDCWLSRDGDSQSMKCEEKLCQCKDKLMESSDKQSCNNASMAGIFSLGWLMILALAINVSE